MFTRILTVLVLALSLGACNKDPDPLGLPDLKIYLDRFEEEAAKLGHDFDLSNDELPKGKL